MGKGLQLFWPILNSCVNLAGSLQAPRGQCAMWSNSEPHLTTCERLKGASDTTTSLYLYCWTDLFGLTIATTNRTTTSICTNSYFHSQQTTNIVFRSRKICKLFMKCAAGLVDIVWRKNEVLTIQTWRQAMTASHLLCRSRLVRSLLYQFSTSTIATEATAMAIIINRA